MIDGRVQELLADPAKWTKGSYARDADGEPANEMDPAACSFCLRGAIVKAYGPLGFWNALCRVMNVLERRNDDAGVVKFNDDAKTTHADVMAVLEEAGV